MPETSKLDILIIEDSPLAAKVLNDLIERFPWHAGKQADFCGSAEEGIENLEKRVREGLSLPAFIILDLELPGQHGLQFLKKVKGNPFWKGIPVVVNSGSEKKEDILGAYKGGGVIFVRKSDTEKMFNEIIYQMRNMGILK